MARLRNLGSMDRSSRTEHDDRTAEIRIPHCPTQCAHSFASKCRVPATRWFERNHGSFRIGGFLPLRRDGGRRNQQYGQRRLANAALRDAAEKQALKAAPAVRAHHDQFGIEIGCGFEHERRHVIGRRRFAYPQPLRRPRARAWPASIQRSKPCLARRAGFAGLKDRSQAFRNTAAPSRRHRTARNVAPSEPARSRAALNAPREVWLPSTATRMRVYMEAPHRNGQGQTACVVPRAACTVDTNERPLNDR